MWWAIIRTYLSIGTRSERYTRNKFLSFLLASLSHLAIGVYLYRVSATLTESARWDHSSVFRTGAWLFLLAGISIHLNRTFSQQEADFLNLLPLDPRHLFLARTFEGLSATWGTFIAANGLLFGWAVHAERVNWSISLLCFFQLFLHMNFLGQILEALLTASRINSLRTWLVRVALGSLVLTTLSFFFIGERISELTSILRPVESLVGISWYAAASVEQNGIVAGAQMLVGLFELAGVAFLTFRLRMGRSKTVTVVQTPSSNTSLHQLRALEVPLKQRTPFLALLTKDISLFWRNRTRVISGALFSVILTLVLVVVQVRSNLSLGYLKETKGLLGILLICISVIGPGVMLTWRMYTQDYDFLWLLRLSCDLRHYILSKFTPPFVFCSVLGAVASLVIGRLYDEKLGMLFVVAITSSVVVSALGLLVGAVRLYLGANPRSQDPLTMVATGTGIYLYLMSVVSAFLLSGAPLVVYTVSPFWILCGGAALLISAHTIRVIDLSH